MSQPVVRAAEPLAAQFQTNPPREVPTRRNTELVLLGFATFIVTIALVLVEANQEQELTTSIVRKWAPYADPVLLPCVALLNGIGLVMIHRIDLALAERAAQNGRDYTPAVTAQVLFTVISLVFFVVVLIVVNDHRTLTRYGYTAGLVGIVALALPALLPSSLSEVNGAKVWLKLPFFSIQPGEFAKILLMVFFAAFLVSKRDLFTAAGRRVLGMDLPRARS
jgi:cell division protein FtsW (lipid II flippase)